MGLTALKIEDLPQYTYNDYAQWEGRWELINGIPYAMVPMPGIKHQRLSGKIYKYMSELLENCPYCEVLLPVDWQISDNTIVQPDVLVVCEENIERIDGEKLLIPPVLVFEILSPSTARKDRVLKYQLYEKAGVKYYFIVDADTRSAEVFELNRDTYREIDSNTLKNGKMVLDIGRCSIEIEFSKILK